MARVAVVSLSELGNRMDAGFHVALAELRGRVNELSATVPPDEVARRLDAVPLRDRQVLRVLARGEARRSIGTEAARLIVAEYPYLSLALMEKALAPAIERVRAEIAGNQAALDALLAIGAPEPSDEPAGMRM